MENIFEKEFVAVKDLLHAKLVELKGPDEEESKEEALFEMRINELRDTLHANVERVIDIVRTATSDHIKPLLILGP